MKLIIQESNPTGRPVEESEVKEIRELLSELEEVQSEFDTDTTYEVESTDETEPDELTAEGELTVYEDDDAFLIKINAPVYRKEDFQIEVNEDRMLSVTAGTADSVNRLSHSFQLPEDANTDAIEAVYRDQQLLISIGKNLENEVFEDE